MRSLACGLFFSACLALQAMQPGGWTTLRGSASPDPRLNHDGHPAVRLESDGATDAAAESEPLALVPGRNYELSAWIRTESLAVADSGRTPIATGAAVSLASLPFDVHSESVGGTRDWTRVRLRFIATAAHDRVLLAAGAGGRATGRAWFSDISVEPIGADAPPPEAVRSEGPAYRFATAGGWIYLHIEGRPYERGYQHGRLMSRGIVDYINRCATLLDPHSREHAWEAARVTVNALFLRGFDREILEEMRGIADGAASAGAKWDRRPVDLVDIAALNTFVELDTLDGALPVTRTGLEDLQFDPPKYSEKLGLEHCSAFAATGKATRDGHMVIGHITMWPLLLAEASNVMLDIRPANGHRMLIQSYPGGIQSGLDWYQNDAGVVLTETTIRQGPFNAQGTPVAFRARKAIQYGDNIDKVVEYLGDRNNGLYTNEWLIGDAKNDEVAMYELGTYKTRLWRSSKNQWFGGTEGFYWGCNNVKDLAVRLEYQPDPHGDPAFVPFVPAPRDAKWQELYREYRGRIDAQFGFLAFRTAPLVSSTSMDGKVTTSEMARRMLVWAAFGKPNQREWVPGSGQGEGAVGVYPGGYRLVEARESAPAASAGAAPGKTETPANPYKSRLWKGWILPASDADLWLSAGAAAYYRALSQDDWQKAVEAQRDAYSVARLAGDRPLSALAPSTTSDYWYELAAHKGALVFDALRREIGDEAFLALMRNFFAAHTGARVAVADFRAAAAKAAGRPLDAFFHAWLEAADVPVSGPPVYLVHDLASRLSSALIVYGTTAEAGANRYAAEQLRDRCEELFESAAPVRKDFEPSDAELRSHDVVLVGRPETNALLAAWLPRLGLRYDGVSFRIGGAAHAEGGDALAAAFPNPLNPAHMVLVVAGNSPLATVLQARSLRFAPAPYTVR